MRHRHSNKQWGLCPPLLKPSGTLQEAQPKDNGRSDNAWLQKLGHKRYYRISLACTTPHLKPSHPSTPPTDAKDFGAQSHLVEVKPPCWKHHMGRPYKGETSSSHLNSSFTSLSPNTRQGNEQGFRWSKPPSLKISQYHVDSEESCPHCRSVSKISMVGKLSGLVFFVPEAE